jgi:TolB-like protein
VSKSNRSRLVRFGSFEVDLEAGEIRRRGLRLALQEKPFQILVQLLDKPGEAVSRADLRQELWPPDTYVVFDRSLNTAITKLRRTLGDSADNPRFIETLPRRGYRFIAPVSQATGATISRPEAGKMRLLVLPFDNLSNDPEQEYFSDGLTEEMISQLGQLAPQRLGVIARTTAMQYKHNKKGLQRIGQELSVDYILEGSVRRSGNRVRITAQLSQVRDQTHLWAESYEHNLADIFAAQADVAQNVARSLALQFLTPTASTGSSQTIHPAAHEAYLRGRFFWNQRLESSLKAAVECFEQARRHDRDYAPAFAGLSDCYAVLGWFGAFRPREAGQKARAAAERAVEIDNQLAEAHCSLALVRFWYDWDWRGAERGFLRAIELNPNYATAHQWYASYLAAMGRLTECSKEQKRAQELDPLSLIIALNAGDRFYFAREFDSAVACYRSIIQREPTFSPAYFQLGRALVQKSAYEEAISSFEEAWKLSGNKHAAPALAHAHGLAGGRAKARAFLSDLIPSGNDQPPASSGLALIHLGLGENERALDWLEQGFRQRCLWLIFLQMDPVYDALRVHPRFVQLLRRLRFSENGSRPTQYSPTHKYGPIMERDNSQ